MTSTNQKEYSILAEIYDEVMSNVDYAVWADFIDEIIQVHHPDPQAVLELACGTGSLSLALDRYGCYNITGTDKSTAMIKKARKKAQAAGTAIPFRQMDFLANDLQQTFDIVVCIFDSINYLRSAIDIRLLLEQTQRVMNDQSLFIFDFTTPRNSKQAIKHLNNEDGITENNYHFFRTSQYDTRQRIHYNIFEIEKLTDDLNTVTERYTEEHRQRAYTLNEMRAVIGQTSFEIVAQYRDFDLKEATPNSLRITMVLRCPDTP